jgi:CBS domain-containing protein
MRCNQIMKSTIECIRAEDSVQTAASRMRTSNIGFLPICDEERRVLGTLTDRDIAIRVVADALSPSTPVRSIMTTELVTCRPEDEIATAQQLMGEEHKSRLLCVEEDGRLAGVISLSDIAQHVESSSAAKTMREVAQREVRTP